MTNMFVDNTTKTLDLNNFDTSNVTDMKWMFWNTNATTGYVKDEETALKFNDSSVTRIPNTLKFTVKE